MKRSSSSSSSFRPSVVRLELLDDGRASPDVLQNDGIYSAYVTSAALKRTFSSSFSKSVFSVSVTAINGGGARVPKDGHGQGHGHGHGHQQPRVAPSCCGQSVRYSDAEPSGAFVRHAAGPAFAFDLGGGGGGGGGGDTSPPSRILDLRLEAVERRSYGVWAASLAWTAAGDDLSEGQGQNLF